MMKPVLRLFSLSVLSLAPLAWPQSTAPQAPLTPLPSLAAPAAVKPRGPDAVATQDPNRVIATIGGEKITAKQALDMLKPFPPEQRKQIESNLSGNLQQIYTQHQLALAAEKLNLDQQSPWKETLILTRENVLFRAYVDHVSKAANSAPPEDPQKYYDSHEAEFDTVKLSGIFVTFNPPGTPAANGAASGKTEEAARDKANDIEKKLKAGGDFVALARAESDHQTAAKGGDLGTVPINDPQIPPELKAAVAKLQPGEVSEPVHIPGAFLIVKLDKREKVTFDQAKPGLVQRMQAERSQAAVKQEIDKYKIHVEDQDFFDTPATGAKIPSLQVPPPARATPAKP